jgi:hypothetical protein
MLWTLRYHKACVKGNYSGLQLAVKKEPQLETGLLKIKKPVINTGFGVAN